MAINTSTKNKRCRGWEEKGLLLHVGGNANWYNQYGECMEVPQKTKYRTTQCSNTPTPAHITRENIHLKRYMHLYIHHSTSHKSQDMEKTQMSTDTGMD